jgi:homoaconitate hydratase
MGITDVVIQLVTGETYLQVPEVVRINLVNKPPRGIGGKDVILGILGQLKRNTVAAERLVEYTGEGLKYLSSDARFAIANMTTEFGGIGACIVPDAVTAEYVARRKNPKHKMNSIFFRPDDNAEYAATYDIDLSKMETLVALYPSPDNVAPIGQVDLKLDGCFIGACTTAEEDIILAGLVIQECLRQGLRPCIQGTRRLTPGSVPITRRLNGLGLLAAFTEAGFVIGAPGCSYCVGMGADQAGEGEVWLSSQNRNFRDRMGKGSSSLTMLILGSIANLSSAAAVAVSSFDMKVRDPQPFLDKIDWDVYDKMRAQGGATPTTPFEYSDPSPMPHLSTFPTTVQTFNTSALPSILNGRVQRFGDDIDTDSVNFMLPA